jgi:hypothetical protein
VGPVVRWAGATIDRSAELRDGDYWTCRNHFKALLPDTLPGRHALSHLEHLFGQKGDWHSIYSWQAWEHRQVEERRWLMAGSEDCKAERSAVLAGAGTRRLNKRISALTPPTEPVVRQVHDGSDWVEKRIFVPLEPWRYTGEGPDRWLSKPRSRHGETTAPLHGNPTAEMAHRALDEVFAEMFGGRLPYP